MVGWSVCSARVVNRVVKVFGVVAFALVVFALVFVVVVFIVVSSLPFSALVGMPYPLFC